MLTRDCNTLQGGFNSVKSHRTAAFHPRSSAALILIRASRQFSVQQHQKELLVPATDLEKLTSIACSVIRGWGHGASAID